MIYFNNSSKSIKKLNVFGKGEVYKQLRPLISSENINISKELEDITDEKCYLNIKDIKSVGLIYCVGYKDMNKRYEKYIELKNSGFEIISFISNNAILSEHTKIGNGTIINQGSIIDNFVEIGECVFINIGAMISHHTKVNDNVFIAPGVNIAGYVNIEEGCFIGVNATVIDNINIGRYSIVGAGSVVIEDVPPYSVVVGNPARVIKNNRNL